MVANLVRQFFLDSPYRRLIVLTGILVIGVTLILPLADKYFALRKDHARLALELDDAQVMAAGMDAFESRVRKTTRPLGRLEERIVSEAQLHEFRNRIVQLARESGCQIRRIDSDALRSRPWYIDDNALELSVRGAKEKKTEYELKGQSVRLTVRGKLDHLKALLAQLRQEDKLVHTKTMNVRPEGGNRKVGILEIEMWLFDLEHENSAAVKKARSV